MEVPADSDYKCFEDISAEEPAQNWRNFQHDIAGELLISDWMESAGDHVIVSSLNDILLQSNQ